MCICVSLRMRLDWMEVRKRNHTERDDDDVIKVISVTNYFYDMTCNDKKNMTEKSG